MYYTYIVTFRVTVFDIYNCSTCTMHTTEGFTPATIQLQCQMSPEISVKVRNHYAKYRYGTMGGDAGKIVCNRVVGMK